MSVRDSTNLIACVAPGPVADTDGKYGLLAGRYRLDDIIAEGGMGVVYKAWHRLLMRPVAVKMVRGELRHSPELAARFLEEARTGAQLSSVHAVQVFEFGADEDGHHYLVMELLEGRDLREVLNPAGSLPIEEAIGYILQASAALVEAHALGIVHRDLKPENLFLTNETRESFPVVKVLDFGVSKREGRQPFTWTNENIGSPHYMAPEQMVSPGDVDGRADIWSLGAILFELVTGRVPFDGDTVPEICRGVLKDGAPLVRNFRANAPALLERVLCKCLAKNLNDRFGTVEDLAKALRLVLESRNAPASSWNGVRGKGDGTNVASSDAQQEITVLPLDDLIGPQSVRRSVAREESKSSRLGMAPIVSAPTPEVSARHRQRPRRAMLSAAALFALSGLFGVGALASYDEPTSATLSSQADDVAELAHLVAAVGRTGRRFDMASSVERDECEPKPVAARESVPRRAPLVQRARPRSPDTSLSSKREVISTRYGLDDGVQASRAAPRGDPSLKNPYPAL